MITYRDMTFCVNKECIKECKRRLTPQIEEEAKQFGLPLALAEFTCNKEDRNKDIPQEVN